MAFVSWIRKQKGGYNKTIGLGCNFLKYICIYFSYVS